MRLKKVQNSGQNEKGCRFYDNKDEIGSYECLAQKEFYAPWDIEDFVEFGKKHSACSYYAARSLMQDADLIFCPYQYLINPYIRQSMKIDLTNDVVIIDEGHNIEDICREIGSSEFRVTDIAAASQDCSDCFAVVNNACYRIVSYYLDDFKDLIQNEELPELSDKKDEDDDEDENDEREVHREFKGSEMWEKLVKTGMANERFENFCDCSDYLIACYKEKKKGKNPEDKPTVISSETKSFLAKMMRAFNKIKDPEKSKDYGCFITNARFKVPENKDVALGVTISQSPFVQMRRCTFICTNPAVVFREVAAPARCVILASGTLSPTASFESELGVKFGQKLQASHVVPKDQVYLRAISQGPNGVILKAVRENLKKSTFQDELGGLILEVCKTIPHGILCFFASYKMMNRHMSRWQETELWHELEKSKRILEEPKDSKDLNDFMCYYKGLIKKTSFIRPNEGQNGVVLFAVFRGKIAEGIDFKDNEARCVLTVGIPYAKLNDPAIKLKRKYNDDNQSRGLLSGNEWYTVQAYRALNQALGRCIRHRYDWGAILMVDQRLTMLAAHNYLPGWVMQMKQKTWNYNLKDNLKSFVEDQKAKDNEREGI